MIVTAKIFYMLNTTKIQPSLIQYDQNGNCLIGSWIDVLIGILGTTGEDSSLLQKTDDPDAIEQLDNHEWW
jgi:hypothetical protein